MTEWKARTGYQETEPVEFDVTSSPTTVYQKRNVTAVEITDDDVTVSAWSYEERSMTKDEYATYLSDIEKMQVLSDLELSQEEAAISQQEANESIAQMISDLELTIIENTII